MIDSTTSRGGHQVRSSLLAPGLTLGAVGAAAVTGPSLFAKDPKLQKIGFAATAAVGLGLGTGVEAINRSLDDQFGGDHLMSQLATGGAGAALAGGIAAVTKGRVTGVRAGLQTAGLLVAAASTAGAANTEAARVTDALPGTNLIAQGGVSAAAGLGMLALSARRSNAAAGISRLLPDLPELQADASTFGKLAFDRGRGTRGVLTSGNAGSPVEWAKQSGQGQRFLTEMPAAEDIDRVMGTTGAKEPGRSYVSLDHADPALDEDAAMHQRVDLLMQDLEHQGFFGRYETQPDGTVKVLEQPRRHFMLAATTSSGFVNPVAASSFEFMHGGDSVVMAIQSGTKKAAGEMHHMARATATHELILERLAKRFAELPEGVEAPKRYVYGESYGAWTSQNALLGTGDGNMSWLARKLGHWNGEVSWTDGRQMTVEAGRKRFRELGIDKAMYVGTPKFAMLRPGIEGHDELTSGTHPLVRTVKNLLQTKELSADDMANTRITFLQHDADPVGLFHPKLLWEKPEWLGPAATRRENVPPQEHWLPVVTGLQTAFDQQMAQFFKQGVLEAKGHDYRSEVTYVMRRAYGANDVTDQQVARIREWNRQLEEIHEAHQSAAKAAGEIAA